MWNLDKIYIYIYFFSLCVLKTGSSSCPTWPCWSEAVRGPLLSLAADSDVPEVLPSGVCGRGGEVRRAGAGSTHRPQRRSGTRTLYALQDRPGWLHQKHCRDQAVNTYRDNTDFWMMQTEQQASDKQCGWIILWHLHRLDKDSSHIWSNKIQLVENLSIFLCYWYWLHNNRWNDVLIVIIFT